MSEAEDRPEDLRGPDEKFSDGTLAAEQLEEVASMAKRQQDEFSAMLVHDCATLWLHSHSSNLRIQCVHTISDNVSHRVAQMARLFNDLLDASRITSEKVTLQWRQVCVREFIGWRWRPSSV